MHYAEYLDRFGAHARLATVEEYASVVDNGAEHALLRVTTPGERVCTITAGFHGDDSAGPLTLLEHLPEIVAHAERREVGLRIYPNVNPSGLDARARDNDFLRYEIEPGRWVAELQPGDSCSSWQLFVDGPLPIKALRSDLVSQPPPHAALDLGRDPALERALAYAYVFGPASAYLPLVDESGEHLKIARGMAVDEQHETNLSGLVTAHDGSVTDYFFRRGVPYCAAVKTTTRAPSVARQRVNLVWIHGLIELAARLG